MEELTEDNDFGLALAERPSITNQGNVLLIIFTKNVINLVIIYDPYSKWYKSIYIFICFHYHLN